MVSLGILDPQPGDPANQRSLALYDEFGMVVFKFTGADYASAYRSAWCYATGMRCNMVVSESVLSIIKREAP